MSPNRPRRWQARQEESARKRHERLVEQWHNIRRLYLVCAAKWENRQPQASAFPFASVYGPFGAHRSATVRAMVPRLAVRTPQPTHLSNPSSPRSRQQPRYWRRFMTLMRPSIPALNLLALLNHPCRSCSSRFSLFFPALGKHTFFTPISFASRSLLSARCGPLPRALAACRTSADDPPGLASAGLHRRHCPPESRTRL